MDEKVTSKAKFGQEVIEVTALDRSSVGSKGASEVFGNATNHAFKGGVDNLGHSLEGVKAQQDGNGSVKGTKGAALYPSSRG